MSASQIILDVGELIDILSPKFSAIREKHDDLDGVSDELLLAIWLNSNLNNFEIKTEFEHPAMKVETYCDLQDIKDDYALRLLSELIVPPVHQLFPPASSLIARMLIQGRDLILSY